MNRPVRPEEEFEDSYLDRDILSRWEEYVDGLDKYVDYLEDRIDEPVTRVYIDSPDTFEFAYQQMVVNKNSNVRIKAIVFNAVNTATVGSRLKELMDKCPNGRVEEQV